MQISPELKQRLQFVMLAAILVSSARLAYILYQRHESRVEHARKQPPALNADYYVIPKKLYPYDLKSARQLTQQPVWVKVGYANTYYPYDPVRHRVNFSNEAGKLLPIEKLEIKDIISEDAPESPGERQVMAVFQKDAKTYAFSIGSIKDANYKFYSDDMLFIQDPHELYKHWPADVWDAVDKRQVKPGMSELQADFAVGLGIPESSGEAGNRTVNYPNGGNPLSVTYHNDKAVEIKGK
ncbi:MAG TPA: hypothetical protein VNZ03_11800 [Terriglobales bacterium]|nr:hypothetical protein [Terriglobales bacterium]